MNSIEGSLNDMSLNEETRTNESGEDDEGKSAFLQQHPLLIDTILVHVVEFMGPLSVKDTLAYRGVCRKWRDHFQPMLYEAIETQQIVIFESTNPSNNKPFEKPSLSTYQNPIPLSAFLRLRKDAVEVEPLQGIQFRRFKIYNFPKSVHEVETRGVWEFFDVFGPNLQQLELVLYRDHSELEDDAYRRILLNCPNLQQLIFTGATFANETAFTNGIKSHPITAIKKLTFQYDRYLMRTNPSFLKYFLLACPQLEALSLRGWEYSLNLLLAWINQQNIPCCKTLRKLSIYKTSSSSSPIFYPVIGQLKSLRIGSIRLNLTENVTLAADGFFKMLQTQSQSLELLSIERFETSRCFTELFSFPVMPKLRHLQLNLEQNEESFKYWDFDLITFSALFPRLKTLAIGEIPKFVAKTNNTIGQLHGTVESLEFQISFDNNLHVIEFPRNFPNLTILEISIHLNKSARRIQNLWRNLENLKSLYLHVEYIWLKESTVDKFFSGLSNGDFLILSNSMPFFFECPYSWPGHTSESILRLKKLKHLDIKFSLDHNHLDHSSRRGIKKASEFYINTASFWAFSKLPVLEYLKLSGPCSMEEMITDHQVSMIQTAHPLFQCQKVTGRYFCRYKWKIPNVSDRPEKPSKIFEKKF